MRRLLGVVVLVAFWSACEVPTSRLTGYEVHGIDVSRYQSFVNWDMVATQDIHFAFIKATEGESLRDPFFNYNWRELRRVGIIRGAYHFYRPSVHPCDQMENFSMTVQLEPGDMPPVLDIEVTDGAPKALLVAHVKEFLEALEKEYQIKPIIYTNLKFYYNYLHGHVDGYPVWVARYNFRKPELGGSKQWDFWQYANRGRIKGIYGPVDLNVFHGTIDDLKGLCVMPPPVLSML